MSLETEAVLDRRRLRRTLSFWRAAAVLAVTMALAALGAASLGSGSDGGGGLLQKQQIARVAIEGMITEDRAQLAMLRKLAANKSVAAVLLFVNSPGGTTAGGEALYAEIRDLSAKKPVIAQFGTMATSAAYIAGLAADHIVARGNTITGSVGVIFQWPEVSELMAKLGVKMNEIKSGKLKAEPSPFHPLDQAGRETTERMVAESMTWFRGLVAERRKLSPEAIPGLVQGRVFSGREALEHKLVDGIGGEPEAIRYLNEKRGIAKDLKVVDWKPKEDRLSLLGLAGRAASRALGLGGLAESWLADDRNILSLAASGLVSVWQPAER